MHFDKRNARYLRISAHAVLPLYIFLDDRHIEWMSDYVLQRVLADLKPNIGPKLRRESNMFGTSGGSSNAKSGTVDVHRGDNYQFAYFFRRAEPHAVLIKSRKFVPAPKPVSANVLSTEVQPSPPKLRKRKADESEGTARHKKSSRSKNLDASDNDDDSMVEDHPSLTESGQPRRSGRKRSHVAGGYEDVEVQDDIEMIDPEFNHDDDEHDYDYRGTPPSTLQQPRPTDSGSPPILEPGPSFSQVIDVDTEQEEKPKMTLRVSYEGFTIYDRCLCVVIEPWPALRDVSQAPSCGSSRVASLASHGMRMPNVEGMAKQRYTPNALRERTPLFLPEIDPRRSLTPAPLPSRILPPVPLFNESVETEFEDEDDERGMVNFSQVLQSVGDERAGSADEDEDEGDVFLGDADERRGGP